MIIVGLISSIISVVGIAVLLWARRCRRDIERLNHLSRWRNEFFAATIKFCEHDGAPARAIDTLNVLGRYIDHKRIGDVVLSSLMTTRDEPWTVLSEPTPMDDTAPEVQKLYALAIFAFLLSVGYGDQRYGSRILQMLPEILVDPRREKVAAKAISDLRDTGRFASLDGLATVA